jgi:hypothetical protein
MQLVKNEVFSLDAAPSLVIPHEIVRVEHGGWPMDSIGLPQRRGIGPFGAVVEAEGIALPINHARFGMFEESLFESVHGERTPIVSVQEHQTN